MTQQTCTKCRLYDPNGEKDKLTFCLGLDKPEDENDCMVFEPIIMEAVEF